MLFIYKAFILFIYKIWGAPGRQLGGIWEVGAAGVARGGCGVISVQKPCVFLSKVMRPTISPARDERRCHDLRSLPSKNDPRTSPRNPQTTTGPYTRPSEPLQLKTVWGIRNNSTYVIYPHRLTPQGQGFGTALCMNSLLFLPFNLKLSGFILTFRCASDGVLPSPPCLHKR